jgi:Electron transfer DM13
MDGIMNKLFCLLFIITWGMIACSKKNQTTEVPATDVIDTTKAAIKYSGTFVSAPGESVSGKALVLFQSGTYSIALEDLNVANGPDLHVYLSKEIKPVNFIHAGKLKSTKGNQVYALTTNPDFTQYKYVLIFCQQYNVLFGSAELK